LVHLDKNSFVGQQALICESKRAAEKQIVASKSIGSKLSDITRPWVYHRASLRSLRASRCPSQKRQANRQSDLDDLVTGFEKDDRARDLQSEFAKPGSNVEIEITVEAVRHRVGARVARTPFYNPKHKTATPVL